MPVRSDGTPRRSLLCRLGFHDWFALRDRSGDKYAICKRCDKRDLIGPADAGGQFFWGGG